MKIVVASGGTSPEREVSLKSGDTISEMLRKENFDVIKIDITSPSDFFKNWSSFDAQGVYIALHGGWGENGYFQACLELFNIPYTGSGPMASMYAMDKSTAKLFFKNREICTPEGFSATKGDDSLYLSKKLLEKYGEIIIKPNCGGSTVGVTRITKSEEMEKGLLSAWQHEKTALVEAYIAGRETTVTVWEDEHGNVTALPAVEIRPKKGFYDYANKYTEGCTEYLCPAPFSESISNKMREMALEAHNSLGCRGYSRADFRITDEGAIYLLEVNTVPGMTITSLVPMSIRAANMSLSKFLKNIVLTSFKIKRDM